MEHSDRETGVQVSHEERNVEGLPPRSTSPINGVPADEGLSTSASPSEISKTLTNATDIVLNFLSTASNESLGACLVGLGATTYVVLGRVGLVLIGVVGGVALHAAWEGKIENAPSVGLEDKRRKQTGLDIVKRLLDWAPSIVNESRPQTTHASLPANDRDPIGFETYQPATKKALQTLTDAVIRDYVKWWYDPILPSETSFPAACTSTFTLFVHQFSSQLARKRPSDIFLHFATNSSAITTVFLSEISAALTASPNAPTIDAIEAYLALKPDSNLANLTRRSTQEVRLNLVAEDILKRYLEPSAYTCLPVKLFLLQVLARLVLDTTITSCSKPEFINGWIIHLLKEGEPEIMKEIDAGIEGLSADARPAPLETSEAITGIATESKIEKDAQHEQVRGQAQEAMETAMQEAKRLSQMIAEHEAGTAESADLDTSFQHARQPPEGSTLHAAGATSPAPSSVIGDDASDFTTQGINTPASSSQDDLYDTDYPTSLRTAIEAGTPTQPSRGNSGDTSTFTSFDQLPPEFSARAEISADVAPFTLHNAKISIFDGSDPNSRQAIKSKPTMEYMIQIEPASTLHSGWMIIRKYVDFENLHEVLGRIAKVSGAAVFTQAHPALPGWKGSTEARLREDLERYLLDAVRFPSLAESGGLKLFLEKEQATSKITGQKSGFGWPTPIAFENMGKGMVDALTKAPKEVAGGGKALIGGVTGVLSGKQKRQSTLMSAKTTIAKPSAITASPRNSESESRVLPATPQPGQSKAKAGVPIEAQTMGPPQSDIRAVADIDDASMPKSPVENSRPPSAVPNLLEAGELISLPPPPSDMPDDYQYNAMNPPPKPPRPLSQNLPKENPPSLPDPPLAQLDTAKSAVNAGHRNLKPIFEPLSTEETGVAVELMFATITELYTLSSAWGLRRTLLNAAKSFLLRPGSPQLLSIQKLLQDSVLDLSTSDDFIAQQILTLRANALPTEKELAAWPTPPTAEEKEALRIKARKLLCERGMPVALTGVMGQQASSEALGRVFDALQIEEVARGLVFGIMLQALRGIIQ